MLKSLTFFSKILLVACLSLFTLRGLAQQHEVTGKVTDASTGDPIPGATIGVEGTTNGTITDAQGKFSIQISGGQTIEVRTIGYETQKLKYAGQSEFIIKLSPQSTTLNQVVVVGYGTESRANITSSIAKMNPEVMKNVPRSNIGSALQGTVSGLNVINSTGQPGAGPVILLRGAASINNPEPPLVIVDGVIRSYNDIPYQDIESIQVLKDAASTAIYGARADNGVILITTKHGKAGTARISYKFTEGYNTARRGYTYMDAKDYIYYNRLGNLNSGRTLAQVNSSRGYGLLTDPADLASFDIRKFTPATANLLSQGWDTVGDPYGGTIIFKNHENQIANMVFRNTWNQDHYVDVTGGNDKGTYYSSFDYYKEQGVIIGTNYKRFSGNLNGSYKVKPNVEISSGVTASTSNQSGVSGSTINTMYRTLSLWPTFNPWIDSGGKVYPNPGNGINDGNPLYWLQKQNRSDVVNRITAQAAVKWDILPGLYVKGTASGYYQDELQQSFTAATQNYAQYFATSPNPGNTNRPATDYYDRNFQQTYNAIANYTKSFGKHNFNLMLGTEYFDTKEFTMQLAGTQSPTDNIPTVNASTVFAPNNSTDPNRPNNNYSILSAYRIISDFGRLNYNYDGKYLLTLVYRQDGVSSLAAQHRFGFFPGMSAGWNIQKESFFQNSSLSKYVSTLKPRVSYGVNGNVSGLGDYEVQGVYALQGTYNGNAGFLNTGVINPNLTWETSKTIDGGLDLGLLKDRFTLIFDYYDRKTSNLLTNLAVPDYTGFSSVRTNLGTFQNQGYEFTVNANIINNPNGISWTVSGEASFVKSKILQLPYNGQPNNRQGGFQIYDPKSGGLIWVGGLQQGQPMGNVYAFKEVGIFKDQAEVDKVAGNRYDAVAQIAGPNIPTGPGVKGQITPGDVNWLDVDHNDTIDTRDQVYAGNIYPKWTGGFSSNLSYKGLTLYARFQFNLGNVIYNDAVARILGNYQGTFNYITLQKDSWSPANENTMIPKVYYADQVSAPLGKKNYTRINNANATLQSNNSYFYESGNYLACREITLSYDFSHSLLAKTKVLSQSRIYLSADNLFYIKKFSGPSPEPPMSNNTITGVYQGTYPTPKSFVMGVQVSF